MDINDPTYALRGALQKKQVSHRAAILDPKRLGELLAAIDAYGGHIQTRLGAQLLTILHVRPGELRQAKWPEFNLEERVWIVPKDRMKCPSSGILGQMAL